VTPIYKIEIPHRDDWTESTTNRLVQIVSVMMCGYGDPHLTFAYVEQDGFSDLLRIWAPSGERAIGLEQEATAAFEKWNTWVTDWKAKAGGAVDEIADNVLGSPKGATT
jgi:hypothetical protein